jgi:transcriptional regulator with XRE-family HTH domain
MFRMRFKNLLKQRNLTAAELSRRTGVPKQTLSDWLAGTQPRNMEYVRRVAEELKVTAMDLFYGDCQPKKEAPDPIEPGERGFTLASLQRYCDFFECRVLQAEGRYVSVSAKVVVDAATQSMACVSLLREDNSYG